MKSKLPITLVLLFTTSLIFAQPKFADKLIKRDSTIINCEVREIGDDEIKYSQEGLRSDILIGIDKNKVARIIFADGREMKMVDSMSNSEDYSLQRKNAIKFNFLLPASGAVAISYERSLKSGQSIESEIGIISSGNNEEDNMDASGLFLKFGFKFIRDPDFYLKGMRYAHILKGTYFKPELALSSFSYENNTAIFGIDTTNKSGSITKFALLLNVGKQIIYNNRFAVDMFCGVGYSFGGGNDEDLRYFAFTGNAGGSLSMTGGLRVGLLFK
jgi:hypothetical protein